MTDVFRNRPRVLSARLGANPNSSSLSLDVTQLLFGGMGALVLGMVLSTLLRGRRLKHAGTPSSKDLDP